MYPLSPVRPSRREAERFLVLTHELARLSHRIDRSVLATAELNPAQGVALDELWRSGAIPMGELARRLHITAGSATRLVSALQRRGLMKRRVSRSDGRQSYVELTPRGEEVYAQVREDSLRACREMLTLVGRRREPADILDALDLLMTTEKHWAGNQVTTLPLADPDEWIR